MSYRPYMESGALRQMQGLPEPAFDTIVTLLARICDDRSAATAGRGRWRLRVHRIRGDRFLEPAHVQVGSRVHDPDGLLAAVPAVRVDEQLDVAADDDAGLPHAV